MHLLDYMLKEYNPPLGLTAFCCNLKEASKLLPRSYLQPVVEPVEPANGATWKLARPGRRLVCSN